MGITSTVGYTAIDGAAVCSRLVGECAVTGETLTDCEASFAAIIVSPTCQTDLASATCADLTNGSSPLEQTCFPPCSAPGSTQCTTTDTIIECSATGVTRALACKDLCTSRGKTYTGTCGTAFGGQTSSGPQCWCQ